MMLLVLQQVRENLEEVRFAGAEEARHPHADLACDVGVLGVVDGFDVGREEPAKVLVKLPGDHELVEFLPDGGLVQLIRLDDAVDGAADVLLEEFFDLHGRCSYGISRKAR